jgi:hypothetical protein
MHRVPREDVTNYSLAARRAWQTRPKRAGRPRSTSPKRLISVRIEPGLLDQMAVMAEAGLIPSREQAMNRWIAEGITRSLGAGHERPAPGRR